MSDEGREATARWRDDQEADAGIQALLEQGDIDEAVARAVDYVLPIVTPPAPARA